MYLRYLLFGLWLGLLTGPLAQAAVTVVIVSSERSAAYQEAAEALVGELERGGLSRQGVVQLTPAELAASGPLAPRLYVALGTQAATLLAQTELQAPVLSALLPRQSFERIMLAGARKPSSQFSALYLDQPLSRQLELIRLAFPDARRLGVLWGPESQAQAEDLKALARARGLELVEATIGPGEPVFPALKSILQSADLLLAVADPQVFNSGSIQNILLSSFRAQVPLVAFSPAYVRAGALLALHVTPAQMGRQAGTLARSVLQGRALPAVPVHSLEFSVAVNEHVARSLGLTLNSDALAERLRRRESTP